MVLDGIGALPDVVVTDPLTVGIAFGRPSFTTGQGAQ